MKSRLQEKYNKEVIPAIMKEFNLSNMNEVPRLEKIVVNSGIGDIKDKKDVLDTFMQDMTVIAGQKPTFRKARKSEAGFKIRQNEVVGIAVTLRGARMWAFLDKFINIVLPRVRDFSGLNIKGFDTFGNYSVGVKEHVIFPEVNPNTVRATKSLQLTMVTNIPDVERSRAVLTHLGVPFVKGKK